MNYLWIHLKLIVITTLVSIVYSNKCSTNQDCASGKICYYSSENKSKCIKPPSSLNTKIDSSKAFYRARNCKFEHCSRSLVQRLVKRNTNRDVVISKHHKTKHSEKLFKNGKKFKLKDSKIKNKIIYKKNKNKTKACINNKKNIIKKRKIITKVKPATFVQTKTIKTVVTTLPTVVRYTVVNQAPVNQAPVNQPLVNQAPVNQAPVNQAPINQPIVNTCVKAEETQPQQVVIEQPGNMTQEEAESEINTATFVTEEGMGSENNEASEINPNGSAASINTSIVPINQPQQIQTKTIIQPQQQPQTIGQTSAVIQPNAVSANSQTNQQAPLLANPVQATSQITNQTVNTVQATNQSFVPQTNHVETVQTQQETKSVNNQMPVENVAASVPDNSQVYVPIEDQIITNSADISQDYSDSIAKRYDVSDRDNDIKFDLFTRGKPEYRYSRTM